MMGALRRLALLAAALLLAAGAAGAVAPAHVLDGIPGARLAGSGSFSWFGIKLYDARLWVGQAGYRPGAPFALELEYARALSGARIAAASDDEIGKTSAATAAQRAAWLGRMQTLFPDVKAGSRITGVFTADGTVRFYQGNAPLGTIADAQFAQAFAAIWLGPRTSAPRLRAELLKGASPP